MAKKRLVGVDLLKNARCCPPILADPIDDEDADEAAKVFRALGDPARLRLLNLIARAGEICVCDLTEPLDLSQPTISHHLKVLFDAGLVDRQRRGTWVYYRIVSERVEALRAVLSPVTRSPSASRVRSATK